MYFRAILIKLSSSFFGVLALFELLLVAGFSAVFLLPKLADGILTAQTIVRVLMAASMASVVMSLFCWYVIFRPLLRNINKRR